MAAQNLTQIGIPILRGTTTVSIWILPAPMAGAGTITITNSSSVTTIMYGQLWSGMAQVTTADSSGTSASIAGTGTLTASTTTVADNSMAFFCEGASRGDDLTDTSTVWNGSQYPANNYNGVDCVIRLPSASALTTPAGSVSLSMTNAASRDAIAFVFSLAPNGSIAYNSEIIGSPVATTTSFVSNGTIASVVNGMLIVQVATISSSVVTTGVTWEAIPTVHPSFLLNFLT